MEPRQYERKIGPWELIHGFTIAFLYRVSGLQPLCEMAGRTLGSDNPSSVSQALPRPSSSGFVWKLIQHLEAWHRPGRADLVALDGMMLSLAKTLRHGCGKINNRAVGVGVVWAYALNAVGGQCPVRVLQTLEGAWHDTQVMRTVSLIRRGPLYLMDRGFYAFDLLDRWIAQKVRFIVRARSKDLRYTILRELPCPAAVGSVRVALDAWVRLGAASAKLHPVVRLIEATLLSGERLVLVTNQGRLSTAQILETYKKRWHIERFHRFLKETLGLAHAYSFQSKGLLFLLGLALLLATMWAMSWQGDPAITLHVLRATLRALRRPLGLGAVWRRNCCTPKRTRKRSTAKNEAQNR